MRVETLLNILEDVGPGREVVVRLKQPEADIAISRGGRVAVKAAAIEGDKYVVIELGEPVEATG